MDPVVVEEGLSIAPMLMEQVVPQLISVIGVALGILVVWLKSKTGKAIRSNIKSEGIQKTLLWVNGIVMDLVAAASQTTVRELKAKLIDGKITKDEYVAAMNAVKTEVLDKLVAMTMGRLLGDAVVDSVPAAMGLLNAKVEAAVPLAKATQVAAASKDVPANP